MAIHYLPNLQKERLLKVKRQALRTLSPRQQLVMALPQTEVTSRLPGWMHLQEHAFGDEDAILGGDTPTS